MLAAAGRRAQVRRPVSTEKPSPPSQFFVDDSLKRLHRLGADDAAPIDEDRRRAGGSQPLGIRRIGVDLLVESPRIERRGELRHIELELLRIREQRRPLEANRACA